MNLVEIDLNSKGLAYVKAELLIQDAPYTNPIKLRPFKIDTGADVSIIFDDDLITLCSHLGGAGIPKDNLPAIFNWMNNGTDIFEEYNGNLKCPSGNLKDVFIIKKTYLSLYDDQGFISICAEGDSVIRCCFSTNYMEAKSSERSNKSQVSLLGACNLKSLDEMVWKYRNNSKVFLMKN